MGYTTAKEYRKKAKSYRQMGLVVIRQGCLGTGLYFFEKREKYLSLARKEEMRLIEAIFASRNWD